MLTLLGAGQGQNGKEKRLIFSVKTDNAGTSTTNQFTIPTIGTDYLYNIETSDGQSITGRTGNTTITFSNAGTYDVFISGNFSRFNFANTGDRLKLTNLKNFGIYALGSNNQSDSFFGCSNMVISATDTGNFENVTIFSETFRNCSSIIKFPLINMISCDNIQGMFRGCSSLTPFPLLNTSNVSFFANAFSFLSSLTSFPLLNFNNSTNFSLAFRFSPIVNFPANAFDNSLASNYSGAFDSTNLSQQSIDNILVSIDTNGTINGVFNQSGGGNTPSATGLTAKANLISKGWTVTTN